MLAAAMLVRGTVSPRASIRGQGLVEYGLILSLSALVAVVVLVFFGGPLSDALQLIGNAIDQSTTH